jgi:hypothetical protein
MNSRERSVAATRNRLDDAMVIAFVRHIGEDAYVRVLGRASEVGLELLLRAGER